jgi:hypothetical protein
MQAEKLLAKKLQAGEQMRVTMWPNRIVLTENALPVI